MKFTTY